jgi:hypothetical protein
LVGKEARRAAKIQNGPNQEKNPSEEINARKQPALQ